MVLLRDRPLAPTRSEDEDPVVGSINPRNVDRGRRPDVAARNVSHESSSVPFPSEAPTPPSRDNLVGRSLPVDLCP